MGQVVGGVVGGVLAQRSAKKQAKEVEQASELGFNFLQESAVGKSFLPAGGRASDTISDLLGVGGNPAQARNAFKNFQNSSGFDFRVQTGSDAITGNAAARGLLNSGSTLKALNQFGQNTASSEFGNFLGQLGGVADRGIQAGSVIGQAADTATRGKIQAANLRAQGREALAKGVGSAVGGLAGGFAGGGFF